MKFVPALRNPIKLSIRTKLLLVSLALLVIPLLGYHYIQDMEEYLRGEQEKALVENARVIAAVVQSYPDNFQQHESLEDSPTKKNHLYIRPLRSSIQLDGYEDDWIYYRDRILTYSSSNTTETGNQIQPSQLSFRFRVGNYGRYLYALLQVKDKQIIYRRANDPHIDNNDHLLITLLDRKNTLRHYIIATHSPGQVVPYELRGNDSRNARLDDRIKSVWQETPSGYNIELQIPRSLLGNKLSFAVADVNDRNTRKIDTLLATTKNKHPDNVSTISIPTPEIYTVLNRILRSSSRIWLINKNANVIASAGNLTHSGISELEDNETFVDISFQQFVAGLVRLFYQLILPQPANEFQDDLSNASNLTGQEITAALKGQSATMWRQTPDARVNILTATYPIFHHEKIVGAVAVEETSNSVLIVQNKAIEILINVSTFGFIIAMIVLLGFATHLSIRIRKLRDNADKAIGEDGRITGVIMKSSSGDEIGDLTRSFANVLDKLSHYNRYLETMASKLSHELRTPITVVKSSLENLEHGRLEEQDIAYIDRAREGIERLNGILTRMSEATRLEQTLQNEQYVEFDIEAIISSCIKGYELAKPEQKFQFKVDKTEPPSKQLIVRGAPDLIAQMLDKLISNAMSFTKPGAPIIVHLQPHSDSVVLSIKNEGPALPQGMQNSLFDSMVSIRAKKGAEPHLGLGLYIVRLIVEFHNGKVSAVNRDDVEGVQFSVSLPLES